MFGAFGTMQKVRHKVTDRASGGFGGDEIGIIHLIEIVIDNTDRYGVEGFP